MTPKTFHKSIIELVLKNCTPLTIFSQPAFQMLIGEMARKFNTSFDSHNIRRVIINEAKTKKNEQ